MQQSNRNINKWSNLSLKHALNRGFPSRVVLNIESLYFRCRIKGRFFLPGFWKSYFSFLRKLELGKGNHTQSNLEGKQDLLVSHLIYNAVSGRQIFSAFCYEFSSINTPLCVLLNTPCQYKPSELLWVYAASEIYIVSIMNTSSMQTQLWWKRIIVNLSYQQ